MEGDPQSDLDAGDPARNQPACPHVRRTRSGLLRTGLRPLQSGGPPPQGRPRPADPGRTAGGPQSFAYSGRPARYPAGDRAGLSGLRSPNRDRLETLRRESHGAESRLRQIVRRFHLRLLPERRESSPVDWGVGRKKSAGPGADRHVRGRPTHRRRFVTFGVAVELYGGSPLDTRRRAELESFAPTRTDAGDTRGGGLRGEQGEPSVRSPQLQRGAAGGGAVSASQRRRHGDGDGCPARPPALSSHSPQPLHHFRHEHLLQLVSDPLRKALQRRPESGSRLYLVEESADQSPAHGPERIRSLGVSDHSSLACRQRLLYDGNL